MNRLTQEAAGIHVRTRGLVPIVEVIGDLDLQEVRALDATLLHACQSASQEVIVSLAKAEYVDSGAVRIIMRVANQLEQENRHLLLVAPRDQTPRRVLEIVYMTSDLLPFESVDEALAAASTTP